jgi:hypothetical protein
MKAPADHLGDEDLILYHYGEAPDAAAVEARLAASAEARRRYDELRRLLAAADQWTAPELPASWSDEVWNRLQPRLAAEPRSGSASKRDGLASVTDSRHRFGQRARRWVPAAAAAALLLFVGYLAGRFAPREELPGRPQALSTEARQRILVETLAEHLERSQRVFTELTNGELDGERQAARELLADNRLYRTAAERGGRDGIAALLADMEPVLLELAHLPDDPEPGEVDFLRQRIDSQGLLFKTRVASDLLQRSLREPATPSNRSTV